MDGEVVEDALSNMAEGLYDPAIQATLVAVTDADATELMINTL